MRPPRSCPAAKPPAPRSGLVAACAAAALAVLATLAGPPARAQVAARTWVPLDEAAPGTPAEVTLDAAASGAGDTWFDVTIHGFWVEPRVGPDAATYHKVDVPGLQNLGIVGAPHLPIVRQRLALVTDAGQATLVDVTPLAPARSFGLHLWPEPVPEMTGQFLVPEQFTIDPVIYASPGPYPAAPGAGGPRTVIHRSVPTSTLEAHPCTWFPSGDVFQVLPSSRWHFAHPGAAQAFDAITRDRARLCRSLMLNWSAVETAIPINVHDYQGEFLFLYPSGYGAALKPIIAQKKWRGFAVTQIVTDTLGSITCDRVKDVVRSWCRSTPSERDHYCLLAGDIDRIPMCNTGTDLSPEWTDDLYATLDDNTLGHDVFVGRLAAVGAADLSRQVTKILAYEDHPVAAPVYYGDVLLAAHRSGFETAQEAVRTAPYAVTPNFFTYYGTDPGSSNAGLAARINAGFGITCYRGHGGPGQWWQWDRVSSCGGGLGECFTSGNVDALANGSLTTVVWSVACSNSDLYDADCIARHWMSRFPGGAVAHYAATRPSNTSPNNQLGLSLFDAVWNKGLTNQSHAIAWAEDQMVGYDNQAGGLNAYLYTLLGDPEMQIRRAVQPGWNLAHPASVSISSGTEIDVHITDPSGAPVPVALVSLWKPAASAGPGATAASGGDEVAVNAYSGDDGVARFTVAPQSTGFIMLAVRDSAGNSVVDSIAVEQAAGVGDAAPSRPGLRAVPTVARARTRWVFGAPLAAGAGIEVYAADGRRVASLRPPPGARQMDWPTADGSGRPLPSGLYFARLRSGAFDATARVVVLR